MNISQFVNGVNGKHHFTSIESGHVFWKVVLVFAKQCQDIPAHIVVHYQVLHKVEGWRGGGMEREDGGKVEGWRGGVGRWDTDLRFHIVLPTLLKDLGYLVPCETLEQK